MGWTESYSISYHSTEIITYTSTIPCLITTSYTTTYVNDCNDCHGPTAATTTVCSSKSCSAGPYSVVPTPFAPGEPADAELEDAAQNFLGSVQVDPAQCSQYFPFVSVVEAQGLEPCNDEDDDNNHDDNNDYGTCGISVIQYAYVTNGQTIHTATTIPQHGCGPYNNLSGVASRHDSSGIHVLFLIWSVAAVTSVLGILLL